MAKTALDKGILLGKEFTKDDEELFMEQHRANIILREAVDEFHQFQLKLAPRVHCLVVRNQVWVANHRWTVELLSFGVTEARMRFTQIWICSNTGEVSTIPGNNPGEVPGFYGFELPITRIQTLHYTQNIRVSPYGFSDNLLSEYRGKFLERIKQLPNFSRAFDLIE